MIDSHFQTLKSNLELTDSFDENVQQKHNAVQSRVQNLFPNAKTKLIGSMQRRTKIQPRAEDKFDIDILVILGEFNRWAGFGEVGMTPQSAIDAVQTVIQNESRYGDMNIGSDAPTVFFDYSDDIQVQLVPAYLDKVGASPNGAAHQPVGRGYWVPKNGQWELTDYDYDADYVTNQNTATNGWLIPTIKMLKSARRTHFPDMGSFHLEILAALAIPDLYNTYKQNNIPITYPNLIQGFFVETHPYVQGGIKFPGSLTPHVELQPYQKPQVSQMFETIKNHCNAIPNLTSLSAQAKAWKDLFGDPYPSV